MHPTNTITLFQLRFIHCTVVSPFILHCLSFSLTVKWIGEKSLKDCQWIVTGYITSCKWPNAYMYMIALSVKIIQAQCFYHVLIQVSQDDLKLRLMCVFLGCDLLMQLLLKSLSSAYNDRLVDPFHHIPIHAAIKLRNNYVCNIIFL